MNLTWPPPTGALVTIKSVCCGRLTAETRFEWDGQAHQFIGRPCPTVAYGQHEPSISATWTVLSEVTE
jgi:hypothetical protein